MSEVKTPFDLFKNSESTGSKLTALFSKETENVVERPKKTRTYVPPKEEEVYKVASSAEEVIQEQKQDFENQKKKKSRSSKNQDDNEDLESNYMEKYLEDNDETEVSEETSNQREDSGNDVEMKERSEEINIEASTGSDAKVKTLDLQHEELLKAERTLFVGNLNSEIMSSKKMEKDFKKKFGEFGKIESFRFRSILFEEQIPKKAAFITKKFSDTKDNVNCYLVFKEKESIKKAISLNGKILFDRHVRVDSVSHPFKKDNNRCVFIGNLDFFEVEESLWRFFEKYNAGEVEYVRIVRDAKTNIGKGFAYVQFTETVSVSKALTLNGKPLESFNTKSSDGDRKTKNRPLRITRANKSNNDKKRAISRNIVNSDSYRKLSETQKTKLGRAKTILNKRAKNDATKFRKSSNVLVLEGARSQEGKGISVKNGKIRGPRVKKPRHTERSKRFRKLREESEGKKA